MIHPTAIVHPGAQLDPTVEVGPYAVIDEQVVVGAHCWIGPHVHLTGVTRIGEHNRFHTGCVIGDAPQDLKYQGQPTGLCIGSHNVFREHVTLHRSNKLGEDTVIGSCNFLMAHCHVGHNSVVGDRVIMANGALLGGHVQVQDQAFLSGTCLVHQFVRVGRLALMQGGAGISKDLPPFTVARGNNQIAGLNTVGLRRAGFDSATRLELRQLYHTLFRGGGNLRAAVAEARQRFTSEAARALIEFVATSKRGLCRGHRKGASAEGLAED
jgi:UDP-N-acetylglucosamine acyltransferase